MTLQVPYGMTKAEAKRRRDAAARRASEAQKPGLIGRFFAAR